MKKLIAFLVSGIMAVTASMTSSIVTEAAETVTYTIQDAKNLRDFLLNKPTEEDLSGKPYDLNGDDRWDVFDLCLMKREVLKQMENQNDTLVVYFSRTGNTEKIAEYLIELTNADRYEIEAAVPYTDDDIAYTNSSCRANKEQNDKTARPEIAEPIESINSYDVIYLGYPIWWGEEPRIIDTFLESYDFSEKIVVPFCTSASSGNAASENNIANLVPIGNQLEGKRFSASMSKESVEIWLNEKQAEISDIRKSSEKTKGDDLPGTNIALYEDVQYCNKLSQKEGLASCYTISGNTVTWDKSANVYHLPTEAEWKYAARLKFFLFQRRVFRGCL